MEREARQTSQEGETPAPGLEATSRPQMPPCPAWGQPLSLSCRVPLPTLGSHCRTQHSSSEVQLSPVTRLMQPKATPGLSQGAGRCRALSLLGATTLDGGYLHCGQGLRSHGLNGERVVLHGGPDEG